jgi:CubicO group peptidase (beta-lactamase class C family)
MHLSSGLYTEAGGDRQNEIYQSGAPIVETAVANIVDSAPGTRFVYAGGDPILLARALHEAVGDEANWLTYPYQELLWKIGMTRTFLETDVNNDLISSGQCWSTARDYGRLGLLYLGDGLWNGERILPEGWSKYVATPAPAQRPSRSARNIRYGGQFWVYGGVDGLPEDAYSAVGAMGQYAMIVPSQNLVVVRRGYDAAAGFKMSKFTVDMIAALGK